MAFETLNPIGPGLEGNAPATQTSAEPRPNALTNDSLMDRPLEVGSQEHQNRLNARREGALLSDATIVAKPLEIPGFNKVTMKNSNISIRWVNWKARDGLQVERMKLAGFEMAQPEDVDIAGLKFRDGELRNGDLVLMKISRPEYLGALKWNARVAQQRVSRENLLAAGVGEIRKAIQNPTGEGRIETIDGQPRIVAEHVDIGQTPQLSQKIQAFVPTGIDIPAIAPEGKLAHPDPARGA